MQLLSRSQQSYGSRCYPVAGRRGSTVFSQAGQIPMPVIIMKYGTGTQHSGRTEDVCIKAEHQLSYRCTGCLWSVELPMARVLHLLLAVAQLGA